MRNSACREAVCRGRGDLQVTGTGGKWAGNHRSARPDNTVHIVTNNREHIRLFFCAIQDFRTIV